MKGSQSQPGQPKYMLVRKGLVQRMMVEIDGRPMKVWPVFEKIEDAKRFARQIGRRVSPTRIGAIPGETLGGHIAMAIDEGVKAAITPVGWNKDGSPILAHCFLS